MYANVFVLNEPFVLYRRFFFRVFHRQQRQ